MKGGIDELTYNSKSSKRKGDSMMDAKRDVGATVNVGLVLASVCSVLLVCVCSSVALGAQATYYVSPTGSDSNPGTEAAPFATLEKARDVVRTINSSMTGDILVYLRGGRYEFSNTFALETQDSGTNGHSVIYQAYPNETPRISGGRTITGWTDTDQDGIYTASMGAASFRQMYVDDRRAIRARQLSLDNGTDMGPYYQMNSWDLTNKTVSIDASDISNWSNLNQVEMVIKQHWAQTRMRIDSYTINGNEAIVTPLAEELESCFRSSPPAYSHNNQTYYFENAMEFLDEPGEWYCNTSTQQVHYKPRAGENMSNVQVIVPKQMENLVEVSDASDIQFKGLTIEHSAWSEPDDQGYAGGQACQYFTDVEPELVPASVPGAVHIEESSNIVLEDNVIQHTGGSGIVTALGSHDNLIKGNLVQDIAANGIHLNLDFVGGDPTTYNDVVSHNSVTRVGRDYTGGVGIVGSFVYDTVVEHNEVWDAPYSGISMGWGWSHTPFPRLRGNEVCYNEVHHVMQLHDDGAGIYMLGSQRGGEVYQNWVHDIAESRWAENYSVAGLYFDNGSSYTIGEDNVLTNLDDADTNINLNDTGPLRLINNDQLDPLVMRKAGPTRIITPQGIANASFEDGIMSGVVDNWTPVQTSGTYGDGVTYWQGSGPGPLPDQDHDLAICQYGGAHSSGLYQVLYLEPGTEFDISFWDHTSPQCLSTVTTTTRVFNTDLDSTWTPATEADFLTASPTDGWAVDTSTAGWVEHISPTLVSNGRLVLAMYSDGYGVDYTGSRWDHWDLNIISQPVILDGDTDLDGDVDNVDFGALYGCFTGPVETGEDDPNRANLIYGPTSGYVILDATDATGDGGAVGGGVITSWALENDEDAFPNTFEPFFYPFASSLETNTPGQISQTDLGMDGFSSLWDLGNIFPTGMDIYELRDYLSLASYTGEPGTGNFDFDLIIGPDRPVAADIDGDGDVDNVDFGTLYGNWTDALAGGMDLQVTPEPATLVVIGLGACLSLRRRRK